MPAQLVFSFLVLTTVALNTLAQICLKTGAGQNPLNVYLLGGIVAYGTSTLVYILILGKLNLSFVYPVVIGLTVVATTMAGVFLLKEKVSVVNWMGIGLILSGICAVASGKSI